MQRFPLFPPVFSAALLVVCAAATAQTPAMDAHARHGQDREKCMTHNTQDSLATCLREANNAAADKRRGVLDSGTNYAANALARCDVLTGEDKAACQARIAGYGSTSGSVAGGGVIREVETVVVPANATSVVVEPRTSDPVLVIQPAK